MGQMLVSLDSVGGLLISPGKERGGITADENKGGEKAGR